MRLHFQNTGTGPPLIILHGLFGAGDNWAGVAAKLGKMFNVFSLDLRNHGRSPHSDVLNYAAMIEDVQEFISEKDLGSAHLLGHSMGGKVAMHLALHHARLVRSLVVVDIGPGRQPERHQAILGALTSMDLARFKTRAEMETALAPEIPDLSVRRFLLKSVERDSEGAFRWRLNLPGIQRNYAGLNEAITSSSSFTAPVLFIRGEHSDYIAEADIPAIYRIFPKAVIRTVTGAGHWVHAEAPDAFLEVLTRFYLETGILNEARKLQNPEPA